MIERSCGRTLGHGLACQPGYQCGSCAYIDELEARLDAVEADRDDARRVMKEACEANRVFVARLDAVKEMEGSLEEWVLDGKAMEKRIAELEAQLVDFKDSHADEWMKRKELEEDVAFYKARLDAVAPYIQHLPDCEMVTIYAASYEIKCTCGLEALEQKDG
jgi:chromosome segregation ATPase